MRVLKRVILTGIVLLIAATAALVFYLNTIVARAIEYSGTQHLGVTTTVDSVMVGLLSGRLRISGLRIANPGDYPGDFLFLGHGAIDLDLRSLQEEVIRLPNLTLDDLEIALLRDSGKFSNYDMLIQNLEASEEETAKEIAQEPDDPDEKPTRFEVKDVWLRNIQAKIDMLPQLGPTAKLDVVLEEIHIENLGTERELTSQELFGLLMSEILRSLARSGGGLPGALGEQLKKLSSSSLELGGKLDPKQLEKAAKNTYETFDDNVEKIFRKARKTLENPFGPSKD